MKVVVEQVGEDLYLITYPTKADSEFLYPTHVVNAAKQELWRQYRELEAAAARGVQANVKLLQENKELRAQIEELKQPKRRSVKEVKLLARQVKRTNPA